MFRAVAYSTSHHLEFIGIPDVETDGLTTVACMASNAQDRLAEI